MCTYVNLFLPNELIIVYMSFSPINIGCQLSSMVGSGADDHSKLEELGSLVAQLRERMSDLDRAVTAISNTGEILAVSK